VVFVREIVPRRAVALVARLAYAEPYLALPMRHLIEMPETAAGAGGSVRYEWRQGGRWQSIAAETDGPPATPRAGSEEEFITEHYWGYTRRRDGGTAEYQVAHPRWDVWRACRSRLTCDAAALYGAQFAAVLATPPVSAFVAAGSAIAVFRGRRLPGGAA
jgi:hypothetical protein